MLADHQVWSSSGVLLRVGLIVGVAWILFGIGFGVAWSRSRKMPQARRPIAVATTVVGSIALAAASYVAFLPININGSYTHCGTALVAEPEPPFRSCSPSDFAWHRSAVVVAGAVAAASLGATLLASRRHQRTCESLAI